MAIFNDFPFGRLNGGAIEYFVPTSGCLKATTERKGKKVSVLISNPTEAQMNACGWYRIVNVAENGTDNQVDNIIYHYTGLPEPETEVEEPIEDEGGPNENQPEE